MRQNRRNMRIHNGERPSALMTVQVMEMGLRLDYLMTLLPWQIFQVKTAFEQVKVLQEGQKDRKQIHLREHAW